MHAAAPGLVTTEFAHDFRNLMQVVSSAIRLIEQRLDQTTLAGVAPLIQGAMQSVDRAATLSRQVLGASRGENDFEETVFLDTVLSAMQLPICLAAGPDILVELEIDKSIPPVFCNTLQFEAAILNLVVNARDAMPGGGLLRISLHRGDFHDGTTVILRVADSGCGMSPDTARNALRRNFTTKPAGRGNGLGLAMVNGFAQRTGGSVEIESALNHGTCVILRLPAWHG